MSSSVKVPKLPPCDVCRHMVKVADPNPAEFDGKTVWGPWANMCREHFGHYGVGLGLGRGQQLILAEDEQ